ncbi:hypothetical protein AUEXF2481DRAFT_45076 [Aureobasidium subglaciale EXF-2481]|uniref:Zn(2)-C6 fungal-type domain-containing protein n=1 Tax=Aureobasidium subglaciale (strain EXF-2481) TaxID=1043005 RepID=A0A074Y3J7_AURSE|nr:uncharacterized protein AUEXF2481DRAFT_45076 [Aureobasidium subglaciale EXF-2481]KAI5201930.1 hypothetical protein E4T38_05852 [Aureobasidium subglaciale]KAI5220851.1 hypothetical protein E4T40_05783 [Aureobasidium subglaciale]KAI5224686.1 hypothetical protein E4T41_05559 [Aureobasidium subglaciale]KAI5260924.1 hypothetical protein E4T46_05606 [Aureobasidium subglaciale]KEQ90514.1 hypothetical protein AUEXF2481DRAFT_45076 [Aureobasidium subglaciale EXF-2481]
MSTIKRSTTGCWTCRARRKKCDENGMPCSTCQSLCLPCYGYGERPDWLDGAKLEKAQMENFKMVVKCNKSRRCRQVSNVSFPDVDTATAAKNVSAEAPVDTVAELDIMVDFAKDLEWSNQRYDCAEFDFNLGHCSIPLDSVQISSTQTPSVPPGIIDAALRIRECAVGHPEFGIFDTSVDDMMIIMAPKDVPNKSTDLLTPLSDLSRAPSSPPISSRDSSDRRTELRAPALSVSSLVLSGLSADDQSTWQYYTKTIFPSMFQFLLQDTSQQICAHTMQPELESCLCLQQIIPYVKRFQASELIRFGLKGPADLNAGKESRALEPAPWKHNNLSPACLVHVILAQILLGENGWSNIFEYLSQNVSVQGIDQSWSFSVQVLSLLEVLASTVTGKAPNFASNHLGLIDNSDMLGCVTGVERWLLHCLIRVINLRTWKQEQLSKASLSVTELIATALSIDDDLKQGRVRNEPGRELGDRVRSAFMKVFEAASAVFLQCTLSGSRPEIVEIQRKVMMTIEALNDLPQAALLRRLTWPVCIAASMAIVPAQQEFFRRLHAKVNMVWGPDENICRALRVAFECWRLREHSPAGRTCDWLDGMKSLDCFLLLF